MTPAPAYEHGCLHKRKFHSEIEALNFGRRWNQRPYECPCCGYWHLSSRESDDEYVGRIMAEMPHRRER